MPTQWQSAMTTLERRFPAEWGRRDRVAHHVEGLIVGMQIEPAQMSESAILIAASLEEELSAADESERLALPPPP